MKYKRSRSAVTHAEVTPRILAAIERTENRPPKLATHLLEIEEIQDFIHADTRGAQEPAGYSAPVGHFIDAEMAVVARSLVGLALVILGFVLGKVL